MNKKYEVTNIAHPDHPWLYRIRAKENIDINVRVGDLGGFVENECNLSYEPGDGAWLFGDSICCGAAYVCKDAILRGSAIAKDRAHISRDAVLSGKSIAEDDAIVRGGRMADSARILGNGMLIQSPDTGYRPEAIGRVAVYGKVVGNFLLAGDTVVIPSEEFHNNSRDRIWLYDNKRTVQRETSRDELKPLRTRTRSQDKSR